MYTISSDSLEVSILDPIKDSHRFGLRFCTGGYIFQSRELTTKKDLLSGPTYPDDFVPIHGQGIPDTFNHIPLYASDGCHILGIGKCDIDADRIIELCVWNIEKQSDSSIIFKTEQCFDSYRISIERRVSLYGFVLETYTCIENKGHKYVPISWYPHPFFPPRGDGLLFKLPEETKFDLATGFFSLENGVVRRIPGIDQDKSFQIAKTNTSSLNALIYTSNGYECKMSTDYYSHFTPIWANDCTCSVEPYLDTTVFPGRSVFWSVRYEFCFR